MSERDKLIEVMGAGCARVAVLMMLLAFDAVFGSFVLATLWRWFVVPLGAPAIGAAHAFGLYMVAGLAKQGLARSTEVAALADDELDSFTRTAHALVQGMCLQAVALALGCAAHVFM